ncbi:hypothetical protein [Leisingera sp. SS27]|uniref:hypothetical protein n=1 Tax=Leisingera sp. SS27 TaxID=2979462 RepID=UPI0023306A47|nr:hypothetical protein [Leisingera sp. SS27]
MTTSTSNNGIHAKPINLKYPLQTRFLSINGLLPVSGPGSACLADSNRPSSAIVCYSGSGKTEVAYKVYDTSATISDLRAIQEKLQALQVELLDLLDDEEKLVPETTVQDIVARARAIQSDAAKNNIFLFRWRQDEAAGGSVGLTELFSGRARREESQSGVVIVGGLTVSQLLVGSDDYKAALSGWSKGTKISTYSLGAKHLLYFSEANLSAAIAAKLDGTLDELSKKLSPTQEIALRAYAAIGRAQENQGSFSAVAQKVIPLQEYQETRPVEQVFYSTLTDAETLLEALEDR